MNSTEIQLDNESLEKILDMKLLGIETIADVAEEPAVAKGEHYGSAMRRLKITGSNPSGFTTLKNVIMKSSSVLPTDLGISIFKTEIEAYTQILPKLEEIIKGAGKETGLEAVWPMCYGVRNYDVILLEDLVETGYSMRNRRVPLSSDVATFCVGQLGKFHGLSVAAVRRKIIDPKTLGPNGYTMDIPVLRNIVSGGLNTLADSIETHPQWKCVVPKLRAIGSNVCKELAAVAGKVKDVFPVINHGDCWTNNMLFKYIKGTDVPCSMKFVDYQVVHYSCFGWDLTNLLHTSMDARTRQSCYKEMMENYRNSLVETLKVLNEDTSEVPDLDLMFLTMDKLAPFALMIAFSIFPLTINNLEKPWEFEKAIIDEPVSTHPPEMYQNQIFKASFELDAMRFKSQGLL